MASFNDIYNGKVANWSSPFQRTSEFPLDRSSIFASLADALAYAKGDGSDSRALGATAYVGQIITVYENSKVSVYKIEEDRSLKSIGGGSLAIANFTIANDKVQEATEDNIGQVIYVTTGTDNYPAGPYIVTGVGTVAKLGTTTATGDIAGDVEALKGKVNTLTDPLTNNDPIVIVIENALDGSVKQFNVSPDAFNSANVSFAEYCELSGEDKLRLVLTNGTDTITFNGYNNDANALIGQVGENVITARIINTSFITVTIGSVVEAFELATAKSVEDLAEVVSKLPTFDVVVYTPSEDAEFPAEPKEDALYLIPDGSESNDVYREWIYVNGAWEKLGVHSLDVNAISEALDSKVNAVEGKELISSTLIPVITENQNAIIDLVEVVGEEELLPSDLYDGEAPSSLVAATNILSGEVFDLKSNAVLSITGNDYLTVSESNNVATLTPVMCAIEDATSELTGLADAYDVQQYIKKALEWNDVIA